MKKYKTFFGDEGTSVLSSCLAIYAISLWLLENYYCRELGRREHCMIKPRYDSPKEIFLFCSHFLTVK